MPFNKLTPDALAIMATIVMVAPPMPADARSTLKDCFRVARLLEDELFRPPSPADLGIQPPPDADRTTRLTTAELVASEPEADRTITLTAKEREILLRGLTTLSGKLLEGDCIIPAEWRSARDKLRPLGAGG